ncbi:MAG: hypothetical protein LIP77_00480 [Planctomycetes bacterium]|nr:hypothetical protein [Planctomycetota bacterium]
MVLKRKLAAALNRQLLLRLDSAYLFCKMAEWLALRGAPEASAWMRDRARSETRAALALFAHLVERGGSVGVGIMTARKYTFRSAADLQRQYALQRCGLRRSAAFLVGLAVRYRDGAVVDLARRLEPAPAEGAEVFRPDECRTGEEIAGPGAYWSEAEIIPA